MALAALPPFTVLLARVGLAAAALWIGARAAGYRLARSLQDWAPLVVMATLNNVVPFSLILWGQTRRERARRHPQCLRAALHRGARPLP